MPKRGSDSFANVNLRMSRRRVISVILLAVYLVAMSANALGILVCDCAAHHSHDLCCGSHSHSHHDCHDRDHSLCAAFCDTESCNESLAQHCSCRHNHGEGSAFTLSSDTDELLKYIKLFAACQGCQFSVSRTNGGVEHTSVVRCRDDIPIAVPPVLSAGAPRAPSFLA